MHVNVQLRFNSAIGKQAPYYRLKESYRDVRGNVHSLIVLNLGFEPSLLPIQVKRIALVLTDRFNRRNTPSIFPDKLIGLPEEECIYEKQYWQRMLDESGIDRFNEKEGAANKEGARYIDLDTVEHTDARNVDAEWLCNIDNRIVLFDLTYAELNIIPTNDRNRLIL